VGHIAAGFLRDHPEWSVRVVDPSGEALKHGRKAFPGVHFEQASITDPVVTATDSKRHDIVIVSGVLCWVERDLLARAVANTDAALADAGLLVLSDFDPAYPRANPYRHSDGLFTYKQDYSSCYLALGIYHLEYRRSSLANSGADQRDPYDRHWMTTVLRRDLEGRYARID
jgi:SAM-dependent methyltransferase